MNCGAKTGSWKLHNRGLVLYSLAVEVQAIRRLLRSGLRHVVVKRVAGALPWFLLASLLVFCLLLPYSVSVEGRYARPAAAKAQMAVFFIALKAYRADVGEFPNETQGLQALRTNPGVPGWNGPYLPANIPSDPWGVSYRYRFYRGQPQITSIGSGTAIVGSKDE